MRCDKLPQLSVFYHQGLGQEHHHLQHYYWELAEAANFDSLLEGL